MVGKEVKDSIHYIIYCSAHKKICVTRIANKGVWIPFCECDHKKEMWSAVADRFLEPLLGLEKWPHFAVNFLYIKTSEATDFVRRDALMIVDPIRKEPKKCCHDTEQFQWVAVKDLHTIHFLGPEVHHWVKFWVQDFNVTDKREVWIDSSNALKHFCDRTEQCQQKEQFLVKSANFLKKDILGLYDSFVSHCWPSQFMNLKRFRSFFKTVNIEIADNLIDRTFQAFDSRRRGYLAFNQVLLGLAAYDRNSEHGSFAGALRCEYIFRFYDLNSDGFLTEADICRMIADIQKTPSRNKIKGRAEDHAKKLIQHFGSNHRLSCEQMIRAISALKFRGTSSLFRATGQTVSKQSAPVSSEGQIAALVKQNDYKGRCEACVDKTIYISQYIYKMDSNGKVWGVSEVAPTENLPSIVLKNDIDENFKLAKDIIDRIQRIYAVRWPQTGHTGPESVEQLDSWFYSSKALLNKRLIQLCERAKPVFEAEERVLQVSTPVYIFGDIHGNLKDLMIFADQFWRSAPYLFPTNYLFLGDYVDRGEYGVECCAYLLALKLVAPHKFSLCRGNHEVRSLQEVFTFVTECYNKYSDQVWEAFNHVFDRLPLAAIVDNRLFCCHGGIPSTDPDVDHLRAIPRVLPDPQTIPSAWELIWNDPMSEDEFRALAAFERQELESNNGFMPNLKRGTGCYYSEIAVDRFLQQNDLQFVIRAHECIPSGYKFLMNGKVITIFSTSLYCGMRNEAAVLYVHRDYIRLIRVETFQN